MDLAKLRADALAAAQRIEDAAAAENRGFTDDERAAHAEHLATAKALAEDIKARAAAEAERNAQLPELAGAAKGDGAPQAAGGSLQVTERDPGHYRPGAEHSYFADALAVQQRRDNGEALERLRATDAFERANPENAWTVGGAGTGQEYAPPNYLQNLFIERAVGQSVLANLVSVHPLPPTGRSVVVPKMTGDAQVDEHDETSTATTTTPSTSSSSGTIYNLVGIVDASAFLRDRGAPYIDQIIMSHFAKLQALKLDTRLASGSGTGQGLGVLNVSGKRTATLSSSGSLSAAFPKIADVITQVEENHYASPTAIAVAVRRWGAFAAELDSTNRPLMVPAAVGAVNPTAAAEGNPTPANHGFTGYTIQGVPVYKVPAMPKTLGGSTNQDAIIAADWEAIHLFLGGVVFDVSDQAAFKQVGISYRSQQAYAIVADGDPNAIGVITGAGLVAPTF